MGISGQGVKMYQDREVCKGMIFIPSFTEVGELVCILLTSVFEFGDRPTHTHTHRTAKKELRMETHTEKHLRLNNHGFSALADCKVHNK
jgi:hypothetical protein